MNSATSNSAGAASPPFAMGRSVRGARRVGIASIAAVAALVATHSPAVSQGMANGLANLMQVCIAALLAPDELPAVLSARGMSDGGPAQVPPGWDGTVFVGHEGRRAVTLGHQRYSDLRVTTCTLAINAASTYDDLAELRTLLEGDPRIGKLEGRILTATPTVRMATFKRPGNAPIVLFNFTASATSTSLVMSRMDLAPEG